MTPTPRTFSHIGISVPDLDAAVKFYSEVMGFYVIMQPSEVFGPIGYITPAKAEEAFYANLNTLDKVA